MRDEEGLNYPAARRGETADLYHGTRVPDPYRWLEDPDAPETRAWVGAQNELTFGAIRSDPRHAAVRARLERLWNYARYSVPQREGGRYFFLRNDGLQNQAVLYTAR